MPTTLPGLPNREAGWIVQQMDKKLKTFPEVDRVFGKIGRADTSTDPAPLTMIETTVLLKPKSAWRKGMTKDKLVAEMDRSAETLGYVNAWVQPIRGRVMMQSTGIQTPVGIKVKGPEVAVVEQISQQIEQLLRRLPGTKSVIAERRCARRRSPKGARRSKSHCGRSLARQPPLVPAPPLRPASRSRHAACDSWLYPRCPGPARRP